MAKKMLIDATNAEETRVVVVDGNKVEEFDFESQKKRQLAGNIYLAKVTRVEPSLQAAFVDYGGNRHGFLAFSEIHPDYYQIPVADRESLMAEEKAYAEAMEAQAEKDAEEKPKRRRRSRSKPAAVEVKDPTQTKDVDAIEGMETIDVADLTSAEDALPVDDAGIVAVEPVEASETPVDPTAEQSEEAVEATPEEDTSTDDAQAFSEDETAPSGDDHEEEARDTGIESVAQEDDSEDVRPVRKPRPRRYKIQEVIKVRQVMLIQVVKEERGNKGAALTTYLSLAGKYCVLMPNTARGGGISRKITNIADRKKLKDIATTIHVPEGAGLIVRTAGAKRTKSEIKRDYEYLQRMWEQIRELTLKSTAPAAIYEEGDLIKRSIRDLYNREIDEVLVEGEAGYRNAKDTMKMIMPSHAKNVKRYADGMPLFARYQVDSFLDGMFNPTVQLKSGGYIVIDVTEALVAVDVNSGRATKEGSIEQTAVHTNLEAAEEVARQVRLRDLAGLIVIDFIDMEERRNNIAVEKRLKDSLKTDRARIQVGRISGFGLMEMSRQRLRPGMLEASTQPCPHCHGTGLIRSEDSLGLTILREVEEEGVRRRSKEVVIKAPVSIANFLINQKRERIGQIEQAHGLSIRIEADPFLISPDYSIEKLKTATRMVPTATAAIVSSVDLSLMEEIDETVEVQETPEADTAEEAPKKKRRRRRRRRGGAGNSDEASENQSSDENDVSTDQPAEDAVAVEAGEPAADAATDEAAKPKTRRRRSRSKPAVVEDNAGGEAQGEATSEVPVADGEDAPKPKTRTRRRASKKEAAVSEDVVAEAESETPEAPAKRTRTRRKPAAKAAASETVATADAAAEADVSSDAQTVPAEAAPVAATVVQETAAVAEAPVEAPVVQAPVEAPAPEVAVEATPAPEPEPEKPAAPKRRGWWSRG